MELLNSTLIDMYLIPHIFNSTANLNFTWKVVELPPDHRHIIFQLVFEDPVNISPHLIQDMLVFHVKNESTA